MTGCSAHGAGRDSPRATRYGSDLVVRVLEQLGVEHASLNSVTSLPASTSLVHARTIRPLPYPNEQVAVPLAHLYAKSRCGR